ncbi:MAG TPA: hypothetical protein VEI49_00545 [Terriglobales bacterium]|nr:hypothetical protein [Terriglobales bacterium]
MTFQSKRVAHEYTQTNNASPEKVFPLLCPVREADWVPDWQYRLIYSESGVAELGCIFTTLNDDGRETTWVVTEYDPAAFKIAFTWFTPGLMLAQIKIQLHTKSPRETTAHIRYTYTGLSEEGNRIVNHYDRNWFNHKMKGWEAAINHYLRTGTKIKANAWE